MFWPRLRHGTDPSGHGFSDHRIREVGDYEIHLYFERNPVKRRLVATAAEYPWSSASGQYPLDEPLGVLACTPRRAMAYRC